ncbi:MAG: Signal peptidase peptidase [Actinomycetota bacterium]
MNFLQSVRVVGTSMAPTLVSGQRALFRKVVRADKSLLNKVVLISRINSAGAQDFYQIKRVTKYENGKFFVSGDNLDASTDSREFGWLEPNEIVGKLLIKF